MKQDAKVYGSDIQYGATWGLDRIDQSDPSLDSRYIYDVDGGKDVIGKRA